MSSILLLTSSPRAESLSTTIATELAEKLKAQSPGSAIVRRDLAANPLPHIDDLFTAAIRKPAEARTAQESEAVKTSDALVNELLAADTIVIGTGLINFNIYSSLKTWIDLVVRPERTFAGTPQGKQGLLRDRAVLAVVSCGGRFSDDAASQKDFFTPYLKYVLGTIGLARVEVMRLESMTRGPDHVARAYDNLRAWCDTAVPALLA